MKCPLHGREKSVFDETDVWKGSKWEFVDCAKEECAWWDKETQQCAIRTIADVTFLRNLFWREELCKK